MGKAERWCWAGRHLLPLPSQNSPFFSLLSLLGTSVDLRAQHSRLDHVVMIAFQLHVGSCTSLQLALLCRTVPSPHTIARSLTIAGLGMASITLAPPKSDETASTLEVYPEADASAPIRSPATLTWRRFAKAVLQWSSLHV